MAFPKGKPRAERGQVGSFCIWGKNSRKPYIFHPTREQADIEAQRLSVKTPGKKFLVMQVLDCAVVDPPPPAGEQGIKAGTDETLKAACPEGREPDPKGCAQTPVSETNQ